MADRVALTIESTISDLNHLAKRGFLSDEEVRSIVKARETMEYRMIKNSSTPLDFLTAIQYEMDLVRSSGDGSPQEESGAQDQEGVRPGVPL